jgi:ferredoxin
MIIHFHFPGGKTVSASATVGERLLEVAQRNDVPLEGTCEGAMACSTCHVIVDAEWFARLPRASSDEDDMLDFAAGIKSTSRLACQIFLRAADDGLRVNIPGTVHNHLRK